MAARQTRTPESKRQKTKITEQETNTRENAAGEGEGVFSTSAALEAAIGYWRDVLADPEANSTAKMNAANGLARLAANDQAGHGGQLHLMSRGELRAEIARVRKELAES